MWCVQYRSFAVKNPLESCNPLGSISCESCKDIAVVILAIPRSTTRMLSSLFPESPCPTRSASSSVNATLCPMAGSSALSSCLSSSLFSAPSLSSLPFVTMARELEPVRSCPYETDTISTLCSNPRISSGSLPLRHGLDGWLYACNTIYAWSSKTKDLAASAQ